MKKILVIGGGFVGLTALNWLRRRCQALAITLVDRKTTFDFLPMLPDAIGRNISPRSLCCSLEEYSKKVGCTFVQEEVRQVDVVNRVVVTARQRMDYDYLLLASGSETNFYGNTLVKENSLTVDSVKDVEKIRDALAKNNFTYCVVAGGGYTGIEVATNLRRYFQSRKQAKKIVVIEKAPTLLGPLPQWMKDYVSYNLQEMGIEVRVNSSIERLEDKTVYTSDQESFLNALVIWTAGVKTSEYIFQSNIEKRNQGRIPVDRYLRFDERCFVAGDAAYYVYRDVVLRMAVQFAITEAQLAAENILRSISQQELLEYKPIDLGYIIPMANNRSCGKILCFDIAGKCPFKHTWICGKLVCLNLRGRSATAFHYFMCLYRMPGFKNKIDLLRGLVF